jgi:hypothetical protein
VNLRKIIASVAIVAAAIGGGATLSACGSQGWNGAYVTGRTMCPDQYGNITTCVIMSDGDLVQVAPSIWTTIQYGYIFSPYNGGYRWITPPSSYGIRTSRITSVTSYSSYTRTHGSVRAVSVSAEASQEASGNTYSAGGSKYTTSPGYKAKVAAAKASYAAAKTQQTGKTGYTPQKSGYTPAKQSGGSGYKSNSGSSGFKSSSGYKSH